MAATYYDDATVRDFKVRGPEVAPIFTAAGVRSMRPKPRGRLFSLELMGRPASCDKRDPSAVTFVLTFVLPFVLTFVAVQRDILQNFTTVMCSENRPKAGKIVSLVSILKTIWHYSLLLLYEAAELTTPSKNRFG